MEIPGQLSVEINTVQSKSLELNGVHVGDSYKRAWFTLFQRGYVRSLTNETITTSFGPEVKAGQSDSGRSLRHYLFWNGKGSSVEVYTLSVPAGEIVTQIITRETGATPERYSFLVRRYRGLGAPTTDAGAMYWCIYSRGPDCGPQGSRIDEQLYLRERDGVIESKLTAGAMLESYWVKGRKSY
ncbi:MAG: hypothetical protein JWO15_1823 [Sphingomonadales bacterium]|nr:hypothetical protein [Sphingomonadales bacterium]